MRKLLVLLVLVVGCGGTPERHVLTAQDVALRDKAKAGGKVEFTDTEQTSHALTCLQSVGDFCVVWRQDPPAGMWYCTDNTTAYSGEFLMFIAPDGGGECAGCNISDASYCRMSNIGDYNDHVYSYKNNTGHAIGEWSNNGWTGGPSVTLPTSGNAVVNSASSISTSMSSFYAW